MPTQYRDRVEFMAELERLTVEADRPAQVVVNERTGTIVMGKEVRISPVAILHGNLTVEIQTTIRFRSRPRLRRDKRRWYRRRRWASKRRRRATSC